MLKLDNVSCQIGGFDLFADLEIGAPLTALIGPSGAGKSTLLNAIAGFAPIQSGQILWQGNVISHLAPNKRPVGVIFQDHNLFPHLSVERNLALALNVTRPDINQTKLIEAALDEVGLTGFAHRKAHEMSGGQIARVALARILLQKRPLLLLDEAFAALGPSLKREMLQLVQKLGKDQQIQIIMISHDPQDAKLVAQEGVVVVAGRVSRPQKIHQLLDNPPQELADYL